MSFYVWTEIVCASCSESSFGQWTKGIIDRHGMKKDAISRKWVLSNKDWYCPVCWKKETK